MCRISKILVECVDALLYVTGGSDLLVRSESSAAGIVEDRSLIPDIEDIKDAQKSYEREFAELELIEGSNINIKIRRFALAVRQQG
jgi:hypothetical protein